MQPHLDPKKLVFIDETGTNTKMARRHGRSPRGKRCRASVPHGHWQTTTLVCGLRSDALVAPMVLAGAMTATPSVPMPTRFWVLVFVRAMWWYWTIFRLTKSGVCGRPSTSRARRCYTCRRTLRISIRLSKSLRSSRHCFAKQPHGLWRVWRQPLLRRWKHFPPKNVPTTSPMQDIKQHDPNML